MEVFPVPDVTIENGVEEKILSFHFEPLSSSSSSSSRCLRMTRKFSERKEEVGERFSLRRLVVRGRERQSAREKGIKACD